MVQTDQTIAGRVAAVRETIAAACQRAGRPPDAVTLVAVSKTQPPARVLEAAAAGVQHFGENRVEEALGKIAQVNAATKADPYTNSLLDIDETTEGLYRAVRNRMVRQRAALAVLEDAPAVYWG